jgi:hypothetical protein
MDTPDPYARHYIRLSTIGSRGIGVAITPSPFPDTSDGATVWLQLHDGPLALNLTAHEAQHLATRLTHVIDTPADHPEHAHAQ